jgi:hypothetical protein
MCLLTTGSSTSVHSVSAGCAWSVGGVKDEANSVGNVETGLAASARIIMGENDAVAREESRFRSALF